MCFELYVNDDDDDDICLTAQLAEERDTVLTLADKEVLAEDAEDVLVNVNIVDDERYKKVSNSYHTPWDLITRKILTA